MAQRQWRSDDTDVWKDRFGNGSDGAGSAPANVQTTITGTSGSTSATAGSGTGFAAGNLILIHQSRNGGSGVGKWEFNKISSVGGGTNWTLAYALTNNYDTTAQVYLMKQFASYNGTLAAGTAWDGTKGGIAGFFCKGDAVITGGNNNSKGYRGGPAGVDQVWSGEGTQGTFVGTWPTARDSGGSGGGGSERNGSNVAAGGGGGGNGAAGSNGVNHNGSAGEGYGGDQVGVAGLTVAVFGGGGGLSTGSVGQDGAPGGAGGGLIIVVAKTITFSGAFTNKGGDGTASDGNHCGGGGAGAGGSILLKGQTITLGSGLIDAGGGTGGNHDSDSSNNGGNGGTGRIHADYSVAISGTTTPTIDTTQDATIKALGGPKVIFFA